MGAGHSHHPSPTSPSASAAAEHKQRLAIVLTLTSVYLLAEVIGGLLTHSLALLADAAHMFTDVGGLALALFAIRLGEKPATSERTYGYYRAEILAALANAIVLIGVSLYVLYEAYERFQNPPTVASKPMLIVAAVGLGVNLAGLFLLRSGSEYSLNLKGAYFEVLSDLLTSVGVIVAAVIMWAKNWYYADPIISAGIGLFIFPRTWLLLKEAVGVLLEGTPSHINLATLREAIASIPDVLEVHDLHVWSLTSGVNAMSVHVVVGDLSKSATVLELTHKVAHQDFHISHITAQIEPKGFQESETHL